MLGLQTDRRTRLRYTRYKRPPPPKTTLAAATMLIVGVVSIKFPSRESARLYSVEWVARNRI